MSEKNKEMAEEKEPVVTAEESATSEAEETVETPTEESELSRLEKEKTELKDKYLRLLAEFENFKRRNAKERLDLIATASQDTLSALLPILDDFDRAKKNADDEQTTEQFSDGVNLVYNKLYTVLKGQGLEPMASDGEVFDPELHYAFTEIPAPSDEMKGKIIDTIEKGYRLGDKIIRHAKVVVGK